MPPLTAFGCGDSLPCCPLSNAVETAMRACRHLQRTRRIRKRDKHTDGRIAASLYGPLLYLALLLEPKRTLAASASRFEYTQDGTDGRRVIYCGVGSWEGKMTCKMTHWPFLHAHPNDTL